MMPPYCSICMDMCEMDGLVSFKRRPSDEEWDRMSEQEGFVGHPPYLAWFCPKHIDAARKLTHLTLDEAMAKM